MKYGFLIYYELYFCQCAAALASSHHSMI